jgi:hypothetical protein
VSTKKFTTFTKTKINNNKFAKKIKEDSRQIIIAKCQNEEILDKLFRQKKENQF